MPTAQLLALFSEIPDSHSCSAVKLDTCWRGGKQSSQPKPAPTDPQPGGGVLV